MQSLPFRHICGLDIKLIEPLYALLEERHVTRAALRCNMSQSAMSRALEKLRAAFGDDLLLRTGSVYERTPRAEQLLSDLADILPRLDAALGGNHFDPTTSGHVFRLATSDYASSTLIPQLIGRLKREAPNCRVDVSTFDESVVGALKPGELMLRSSARTYPDLSTRNCCSPTTSYASYVGVIPSAGRE